MRDGAPSGRMTMGRDTTHFEPNRPDPAFDSVAATAQVKDTLAQTHEQREHAKQVKLAAIAYNAYGETTGWKTHNGGQMPAFEDLGEAVTKAWISAASAARSATL
jgi:hypothetical protein